MSPQSAAAAWPPFLAPLREALEPLRFPEGPFDPAGAWEHQYSVMVLGPERMAAGDHPRPYGTLRLKRTPREAGRFALDADLSTVSRGGAGMALRASIDCAADRLATPRRWELSARIVEGGKPVPETIMQETGELQGGAILRRGKTERKLPAPAAFSCNFSLMEAVQRLPFEGLEPIAFDLFEDLDLHKPGQRLAPVDPVTLDLGGRPVRLHGFRLIGHGILPTHYWLDDQHRLIAATGSLRGYLWNAGAPAPQKGERP